MVRTQYRCGPSRTDIKRVSNGEEANPIFRPAVAALNPPGANGKLNEHP